MNRRARRATTLIVALVLGQIAISNIAALAAPSAGTSIGAIQNSSGVTAFMIKTNKKNKNVSIVLTSPSPQGNSAPKIFIIGTVTVGKDGTAIATSANSIPKKSTISVFSGSKHLISVVDISISKVATLPKSSQSTAASKSVTNQIVQAAVEIWRTKFNKTKDQIPEKSPVSTLALNAAVDSAVATLNAYSFAGGDFQSPLAVAVRSALNARPQVLAEITSATNALREATTQLPAPIDPTILREATDSAVATVKTYTAAGGDIKNQLVVALTSAINARPQVLADITAATNALREEISRLPAPVDPIALKDAMNIALQSINAYLAAGGSNQNELVLSLLETMKVFPPVVADIKAGAEKVREATTQLPPLVDPLQAAIEAELRKLVAKAEALIDAYFAAGGSGEDEVALALLRALNSNPQDMSDIVEAMNALSLATAQLPSPETSEVAIEP